VLLYSLTATPATFALAFLPSPLAGDERLLVEVLRVCATGSTPWKVCWFYELTELGASSPVDLYPRWLVVHAPPYIGQPFAVRVWLVSGGVPGPPADVTCVAGP
jgi:hypothetical protein